MRDFLTRQQTAPPPISLFWFAIMMLLLAILGYASWKYHDNPRFVRLFRCLQLLQLACLYLWYIFYQIPLANSLPFYHCRMAMFALLLCPKGSKVRYYFSLLGLSGAIFALGYPVFDPYDFPHITSFSFLLGHYALYVNSLNDLLQPAKGKILSIKQIVGYTLLMNACLVAVNLLTGGNYGLLSRSPIIQSQDLVLNYVLISAVLIGTLLLFDWIFNHQHLLERLKKQVKN